MDAVLRIRELEKENEQLKQEIEKLATLSCKECDYTNKFFAEKGSYFCRLHRFYSTAEGKCLCGDVDMEKKRLRQEIEELKKSDSSKEQSSVEYYNRAREAERRLENVWYWDSKFDNHLEGMADKLDVLIKARDLRELLTKRDKALELARETLEYNCSQCKPEIKVCNSTLCTSNLALTAINEALGGKE